MSATAIVDQVQARLRALDPAIFAIVAGAAELEKIGKGTPAAMPAAYVVELEEAYGDNERATGGVQQRCELDFAVVVITRNISDARGEAAMQGLRPVRDAVRTALTGWQPDGADDLVLPISGRLVATRDGSVWWETRFGTAVYLEGT